MYRFWEFRDFSDRKRSLRCTFTAKKYTPLIFQAGSGDFFRQVIKNSKLNEIQMRGFSISRPELLYILGV